MASPSTRRAWIEILPRRRSSSVSFVALHPEGVDRNFDTETTGLDAKRSPSTRRAWIEMIWPCRCRVKRRVALHPEGVDRNTTACK